MTLDLERARAFQDSMLPAPPAHADLRIDSAFHPLEQVSGDVFDCHIVEGGVLRMFIADAAGHGVSAALTTMFLRSEYEVASRSGLSPGRLLAALNARLARFVGRFHMHFTAVAMTLDLGSGRLVWASAGHPAPYLVRGGVPRELETGGSFVGLVPGVEFPEWATRLEPGDTVCLRTDGITEALAKEGGPFVDAGLREALADAVRTGAPIGAAVLDAARRFAGALDDDATLLAATWRPAPTREA
jgi:sigma-B regulation protein RsbU (phosphoserine phosphatase)